MDEEKTERAAREYLKCDNLDAPVDVINRKTVQSLQLPFCLISTGKYRQGVSYSYFREGFDSFCFMLTLGGCGEISYRGKESLLYPGDIIFCSSLVPSRNNTSEGEWSFIFVNISGEYCELYEKLWNNGSLDVIHTDAPEYYEKLITQLSQRANQPYTSDELSISLVITQLLTDALNEKYEVCEDYHRRLYPEWVAAAVGKLSGEDGLKLSVTELAESFYMEKNSFIRSFRKYTGKAPKEYSIDCRLEKALRLLREGKLTVTETALETGFSNSSYFTHMFSKKYGLTPSAYRGKLLKF